MQRQILLGTVSTGKFQIAFDISNDIFPRKIGCNNLNLFPTKLLNDDDNDFWLLQVTCNFGRDTFESWGKRKKREVTLPANVIDTGEDVDAQMRLSHEIVVLDFGDEQTSPFDFEKTTTGNSKYFSS